MKNHMLVVSSFLMMIAFITSPAEAVPFEYSITGTASYWTSDNDLLFSDQAISGNFVLSDPVQPCPTCDNGHVNYGLVDVYIGGEGFGLLGSGNIHILFPADRNGIWGSGEPDMDLDLGGYLATEGGGVSVGWDYQSFFLNEDGSYDLSFADDPYRIKFYGSLYHTGNGDRYYVNVSATRGVSVPEPSAMLLLSSLLIGCLILNKTRVFI